MKNRICHLVIVCYIFISFLGVMNITSCSNQQSYFPGRDTFFSFGNGRFQIMRPNKGQQNYNLYDYQKELYIGQNVHEYYQSNPNVYIVGDKEYTILHFKTGEIKQYTDLSNFTKSESDIFRNRSKFSKIQ